MRFRTLGHSGLHVSIAGLGCNNFGMRLDQTGTTAVVQEALDQGITFFDTANVYGGTKSEEFLGKALGKRRSEVLIATKCGMPMGDGLSSRGASRSHIMRSVEGSLRRLGTDYIDLYQMHAPDSRTPIEETLSALDDLVRSGKVRYIGCSNYRSWQIADAAWTAREHHSTPFVSAQNEWNLLTRGVEREINPACEHFGLGMLPFFPLSSGFLTGKYSRGADLPEDTRLAGWQGQTGGRLERLLSDANWDRVEGLTQFAEERGHTLLELALCWLASQPVTASVIAGATKPVQIRSNVSATLAWELTAEELKEVDAIAR